MIAGGKGLFPPGIAASFRVARDPPAATWLDAVRRHTYLRISEGPGSSSELGLTTSNSMELLLI